MVYRGGRRARSLRALRTRRHQQRSLRRDAVNAATFLAGLLLVAVGFAAAAFAAVNTVFVAPPDPPRAVSFTISIPTPIDRAIRSTYPDGRDELSVRLAHVVAAFVVSTELSTNYGAVPQIIPADSTTECWDVEQTEPYPEPAWRFQRLAGAEPTYCGSVVLIIAPEPAVRSGQVSTRATSTFRLEALRGPNFQQHENFAAPLRSRGIAALSEGRPGDPGRTTSVTFDEMTSLRLTGCERIDVALGAASDWQCEPRVMPITSLPHADAFSGYFAGATYVFETRDKALRDAAFLVGAGVLGGLSAQVLVISAGVVGRRTQAPHERIADASTQGDSRRR